MPRYSIKEDGTKVQFTPEEEAARDAEEAQVAAEQADYIANHKYKADRKADYPPIGDQLDALMKQYNADRLGGKALIQDMDDVLGLVLAVKSAHPKP